MPVDIRLKSRTSGASGGPQSLRTGEPAYSHVDGTLYIGHGDDGNGWSTHVRVIGGLGAFNPVSGGKLGVNTTADATNRLAVKSDAVLFSHDDVTPGDGSVRFTVNKKQADKTASLLFQSNWSGRAEVGLTGDDDFHFKVSPDGVIWHEAIRIDHDTGAVHMPAGGFGEGAVVTTDYSAAKGTDLFVNGTGLLDNTYNWPDQYVLDNVIAPLGLPASMRFEGYHPGVVFSHELIPVDPSRVYRLRSYIHEEQPAHLQYMGLAFYDADDLLVQSHHHMRWKEGGVDSLTTLTQPLKPGDTLVHVADASGWNTSSDNAWKRYLAIYAYKNGKGYRYDYYTRLVWKEAFDTVGVDATNNVITLNAPLPSWMGNPDDPNDEWPAGTRIANGTAGATYKYAFYSGLALAQTDTWYRTSAWIGGTDTSGANRMNNFPPGTAKCRVMWLPNYSNRAGGWNGWPDSGAAHKVRYAGASIVEDMNAKVDKQPDGSARLVIPRINAGNDGWEFLSDPSPIIEEVE